jgi:uncharacterized protein YjbJ (UPF0337 family)
MRTEAAGSRQQAEGDDDDGQQAARQQAAGTITDRCGKRRDAARTAAQL